MRDNCYRLDKKLEIRINIDRLGYEKNHESLMRDKPSGIVEGSAIGCSSRRVSLGSSPLEMSSK